MMPNGGICRHHYVITEPANQRMRLVGRCTFCGHVRKFFRTTWGQRRETKW